MRSLFARHHPGPGRPSDRPPGALACAGLCLALLASAATAADTLRTTRLVLGADLMAEAERAQALYVAELERLGLPDDGDADLALAVRSAFPASRIRDRWLRHLAAQLTDEELVAAEAFFESVPGRNLAGALRAGRLDPAAAPPADAPAAYRSAVEAMEADAREAVLRVRTAGAARWLVAREAGAADVDLETAWRRALAEHGDAERETELRALETLAPLHALGFADFATSALGRRFYGKLTAALDVALAELAREHRGMVRAALGRRSGRAEARAQRSG